MKRAYSASVQVFMSRCSSICFDSPKFSLPIPEADLAEEEEAVDELEYCEVTLPKKPKKQEVGFFDLFGLFGLFGFLRYSFEEQHPQLCL